MFSQDFLLLQMMFEIAVRTEFENQVDVFIVTEAIQQLDDVRMFHLMMDADLCIQSIEHRGRTGTGQWMTVDRIRGKAVNILLFQFLPIDL